MTTSDLLIAQGTAPLERALVIINPAAGRAGDAAARRAIASLGRCGVALDLRLTAARGDAEAMARVAAESGRFGAVIVGGGDGTLNEAINGLAGSAVALGLLPLGTANVLAHELGVPTRLDRAVAMIAAGRTRRIHLGRCNGRHFAMMAGVGFDARVVARLDPVLKRRIGKLAYVAGSAREIANHRPTRYRLILDGGAAIEAGSAIVANGHFYAGRFVVAPEARLDRASFDICLFRRNRRIDAWRYSAAMVLGRLPKLGDVAVRRAATIEIDGPTGEPVQADGDIIAALPVKIDLSPHRLVVLAPEAAAEA